MVRAKAKIPGAEKTRLVIYPRKKTIFEQLFGGDAARVESPLAQAARLLHIPVTDLRLLVPGGYLRLMPYTIRVE
jgi:hypothetical protein